MLWRLTATVAAGRASQKLNLRAIAMAVFCVVVLPVIHHLTTIMLCLILILLIVARLVPFVRQTATGGRGAAGERFWPQFFIGGCLLFSITYWWSGLSGSIVGYLGPELAGGFAQLQKMLDGINQTSGPRSLFEGSLNPPYEIVSGYLFPFVLLALFLWSVAVLWRNRRRVGSAPWAFAVLGSMFFASMPLLLTSGAEGAHRSWGYSFIGIAVVCGLAWSRPADRNGDDVATRWRSVWRVFGRPSVTAGVVGILFTVLAFGSAAVGVKVTHRFPGAAEVGDDGRSVSRESAAVAEWLAAHAPVDTRVMRDRFSSLQIGSPGRMATLRPSTTFPVWDLYMSPEPVRLEVLKQVFDSRIDLRSRCADGDHPPELRYLVHPRGARCPRSRRVSASGDRPVQLSAVAAGRYAAGPLTVYEVNTFTLRRTRVGSCEGLGMSELKSHPVSSGDTAVTEHAVNGVPVRPARGRHRRRWGLGTANSEREVPRDRSARLRVLAGSVIGVGCLFVAYWLAPEQGSLFAAPSGAVGWIAMICGIAGVWLVPGLWLSAVMMRFAAGPAAWLGTRISTTFTWYCWSVPLSAIWRSGLGHHPWHPRNDDGGDSRSIARRCARAVEPDCGSRAWIVVAAVIGGGCAQGVILASRLVWSGEDMTYSHDLGLDILIVVGSALLVAAGIVGSPKLPPVLTARNIRTPLVALAVIAITAAALLVMGARWSPAQRMPSAFSAEQIPAPAGADLAFALTAIGPDGSELFDVPTSPRPTTMGARSPSICG